MPAVATLSFEAFCRAEPAWNELLENSLNPLPFLTHSWLRLWWRHFGAGQEFTALAVQEGETLLAAVPLALRPVRFAGAALTVAEIAGTGPVPTRGMGLADKVGLLVRRSAAESGRMLWRELAALHERADVLDLKGFDTAADDGLLTGGSAAPSRFRVLPRSISPYVTLPRSWEDYLQSRSHNFRKQLAKSQRKLEQAGALEIARMEPGSDPSEWIQAMEQVSAASWKAERGTDLTRHPQLRAFVHALAREFAERGWLDFWLLRLDGRPIAYELGFDFAGRIGSYTSSFRQEYASLSPGTALTAALIRSACERGRSEYDLLRGAESYKTRWTETFRSESELLSHAPHWRARAYTEMLALKSRLKRWPWLSRLDDRLSGFVSRLRHRS